MNYEKNIGELRKQGYSIVDNFYSDEEVNRMSNILSAASEEGSSFMRNKDLFAIRQVLKEIPELQEVLFNEQLRSLLPEGYFLTKSIYFDKPGKSNWFVSLHQDISISVDERYDVAGYTNWTFKRGQHGVIPPKEVLENSITIRVHLDDTDDKNGALSVIPQSHVLGIKRIEELEEKGTITCAVKRGGVMLMRPLTFHSSKKSIEDRSRRVIHLEFSNQELKKPLHWLEKLVLN